MFTNHRFFTLLTLMTPLTVISSPAEEKRLTVTVRIPFYVLVKETGYETGYLMRKLWGGIWVLCTWN